MKGLIIYKGKNGSTRTYAEWLKEKGDILICLPEQITKTVVDEADYLQILSTMAGGKLQLSDWLAKNELKLINKRIYLYIVSPSLTYEKLHAKNFLEENIPNLLRRQCSIHFLYGRLVHTKRPKYTYSSN